MNNKRRTEIKNIKERFAIARDMLESVLNDEQDYYDNIPENLLGSMRAEESEEAIGILEDAMEQIEGIIDGLEDIAWAK